MPFDGPLALASSSPALASLLAFSMAMLVMLFCAVLAGCYPDLVFFGGIVLNNDFPNLRGKNIVQAITQFFKYFVEIYRRAEILRPVSGAL